MTSDRHRYVIGIDGLPAGENSSTFAGPTHRQVSIHPVARMETEWLE
ncbi:MAG: hypothetical protein QOH58_1707 [Thermoleophilaceae bacterium]|jgi:hypothetical protein|nr:hypothetical protein [Thermoleophilaceae bacterium]